MKSVTCAFCNAPLIRTNKDYNTSKLKLFFCNHAEKEAYWKQHGLYMTKHFGGRTTTKPQEIMKCLAVKRFAIPARVIASEIGCNPKTLRPHIKRLLEEKKICAVLHGDLRAVKYKVI